MRISVCMPHYNREEQLIRGMKSILAHNDLDLRFCIADDRSRPPLAYSCFAGIEAEVRLNWIMGSPEPLNPCVPINLAVNRAIKHQQPDVIVLTGPEIVHENDALTQMLTVFDENSYVAARCWCNKRGWVAPPEKFHAPIPEVAQFHFCAMFSPALWEKTGGFDEDYRDFQGYDDADFVWRLHKAGATFKMVDAKTTHYHDKPVKWGLPSGESLFYEKWGDLWTDRQ